MISESINSYSLEDAYQSAGIETPNKAKSSSSSSKSSTLSSPVKKNVDIKIKDLTDKKKQQPQLIIKNKESELDSLSSDDESEALKSNSKNNQTDKDAQKQHNKI